MMTNQKRQRKEKIYTEVGKKLAATYTPERREEYSKMMKERWKKGETYKIMGGESHPAWKGELVIYESWHMRHRKNFLKTYCEKCGINRHLVINVQNRGLALHSLDGSMDNCNKDNWITVCTSCHNKLHKPARETYKEKKLKKELLEYVNYLKNLLEEDLTNEDK